MRVLTVLRFFFMCQLAPIRIRSEETGTTGKKRIVPCRRIKNLPAVFWVQSDRQVGEEVFF